MEFAGRNVVVFGGTGGIGECVVRELARGGGHVTVVARDAGRVATLAGEVGGSGVSLDATVRGAVDGCLEAVERRTGRLDAVANCIGSLLLKPAHLTTDEEWDNVLAVHLGTAFRILRASAGRMMRTGGGAIVLMSSVAATRGLIHHEAIAAAKGGIEALARSAAATYARWGIRVNVVAPGLTRTPMTRALTESEAALRASTSMHPLGRIGEPGEVARAVRWLLSPEQSWVTGQVLGVDGGLGTVQAR